VPVPGALNSRDGGGKDDRRPLGCGFEKRPLCSGGPVRGGMPCAEARGVSLHFSSALSALVFTFFAVTSPGLASRKNPEIDF
jgi:hypothetical protein